MCVCALNRPSVSNDRKAQGEVYCLVLQSHKHCRHEAPHKPACNSLTHACVYIYEVDPERLGEFVSFFNAITPGGKRISKTWARSG